MDEDSFIQAFQEVKKVSQSLFITREIVRYENIRQKIVLKIGVIAQLGLQCVHQFLPPPLIVFLRVVYWCRLKQLW